MQCDGDVMRRTAVLRVVEDGCVEGELKLWDVYVHVCSTGENTVTFGYTVGVLYLAG